jgi:diguanylate cyclase (GGDEF)-like protein
VSDQKPRVLVADDDSATRYIISSTLTHEGFHVMEARNGREAIDAYRAFPVDVILMDVEMPGTDGYEACTSIRADENGYDVPIIVVTGNDDPESVDRAYKVGATDFISKPINWSLIGHRLRYILRGVRNQQALSVSEAENRALLAAIPDRIFVVDADGVILTHLTGEDSRFERDELVGTHLDTVFPQDLNKTMNRCVAAVVETGEQSAVEYPMTTAVNGLRWQESRFIAHGERRVLIINRDISERKFAERKIHSLAYYDALTRLPNRPLFNDEFEKVLDVAKQASHSIGVFNIDLDRFKRINDTLGTAAGDAVLVEMAARLGRFADQLTAGDSGISRVRLACLGGDEFALLVVSAVDGHDYLSVAKDLRKMLADSIVLRGHEFVVTASIGVASFPEHGLTVETLLKNAESARDEARRMGSNTQRLYQSSMRSGLTECLSLEIELRRALENDEICLHYQPKYSPHTRRPMGAEAVLRWFHPSRGEIPPLAFIPIAEESGLIADLGRWVADTVCEQVSSWTYFGISPGPIAINVSGLEFGLGNPVDTLTRATRKAGIPASALEIEITESVLMSDIRSVMTHLHSLRDAGFSIAVDDFGTGYSSLRYLQRFPVDVLKIDSSFVHDVERDKDSRAICAAIIAMARSLGLRVVGEGVETKWQLEFLRRQDCDLVQGFLLSEPLSPDRLAELLTMDARKHAADGGVTELASRRDPH